MKTIIKDLTGEMPVESVDKKLEAILADFDKHKYGGRYTEAVQQIKSIFADKPKGRPIEFCELITDTGLSRADIHSFGMNEITRIAKEYCGYDVILCNYRGATLLYLGHWNDGYVEGNDN